MRFAACMALLALLAVSGYAGAGKQHEQMVGVPVMIQMVSQETLTAASLEETRQQLQKRREQALEQLQSVIDDPRADAQTAALALSEKVEIAQRMEMEAAVGMLLFDMGFQETAVVAGRGTLSITAPWQVAENEQNRLRMIDAAADQTGLSPECIKIILAKND